MQDTVSKGRNLFLGGETAIGHSAQRRMLAQGKENIFETSTQHSVGNQSGTPFTTLAAPAVPLQSLLLLAEIPVRALLASYVMSSDGLFTPQVPTILCEDKPGAELPANLWEAMVCACLREQSIGALRMG